MMLLVDFSGPPQPGLLPRMAGVGLDRLCQPARWDRPSTLYVGRDIISQGKVLFVCRWHLCVHHLASGMRRGSLRQSARAARAETAGNGDGAVSLGVISNFTIRSSLFVSGTIADFFFTFPSTAAQVTLPHEAEW